MKVSIRALMVAVAVALALLLLIAAYRFVQVDSCLDRGGRWNHDRGACELATDAQR